MFRQKPRDNKIIPDRLMPDNWNMENKILKFSAFFTWYVQITFSKKKPSKTKPKTPNPQQCPNQTNKTPKNVQACSLFLTIICKMVPR